MRRSRSGHHPPAGAGPLPGSADRSREACPERRICRLAFRQRRQDRVRSRPRRGLALVGSTCGEERRGPIAGKPESSGGIGLPRPAGLVTMGNRRGEGSLAPGGTPVKDAKLREEIVRLARSLFDRGLTPGSSGNISLRLDDGGWLATPTNASLGSLDPARLSHLGQNGRLISGDPPTKELMLHAALYESRDGARSVVHLHSTHAVALSMLPDLDPKEVLPALTAYYLMRVGRTALVPYYRPGDPAVADAIRGLAGRYASVLLANHGPVVAAPSLEAAVFAVEELEETAKLQLLLRGLNPRLLTPAQIRDLVKVFELDPAVAGERRDG